MNQPARDDPSTGFTDANQTDRPHLSVREAEAAEVSRNLQTERPHLLQALHGVVLHLLQGVVLGGVVHFLSTWRENTETFENR